MSEHINMSLVQGPAAAIVHYEGDAKQLVRVQRATRRVYKRLMELTGEYVPHQFEEKNL